MGIDRRTCASLQVALSLGFLAFRWLSLDKGAKGLFPVGH